MAGATLAAQTLTINDTTPAALPIAVTTDVPWIALTCGSANRCIATKAVELVSVTTAGMAAGTYTGHVIATESAAEANGDSVGNSPLSILVTLTLTAPAPSLSLNCATAKSAITATGIPVGTLFTLTITSDGVTATCASTF